MLNSDYRQLCNVVLPYQERQHYMHAFDLTARLELLVRPLRTKG